MSLFKTFKTSTKSEVDGIDLDLGVCVITLARAGGTNQAYNAAMERVMRNHGRAIQNGLLGEHLSREILYRVYADTVVKNWQTRRGDKLAPGIEQDGSDELLPVTADNIAATFAALPDLFLECKLAAESQQYFRQSVLDNAVKN